MPQTGFSRQPDGGATTWKRAEAHLGLTEDGIARRDANVGGEEQLVRAELRTALNGDDDRLRTRRRPESECIDKVRVFRWQYPRRASGDESRHIEAQREIGADAVQHRDAQPVIVLELIIGLPEPDQDRSVEAVQRLRPIDPDQQYGAAPFHGDLSRLGRRRRGGRRWRRRAGAGLREGGAGIDHSGREYGRSGTGNHKVATVDPGAQHVVRVGHDDVSTSLGGPAAP